MFRKASTSQTGSSFGSQLHDCRWGWCRAVFSTKRELAHHVVVEHARKAVPVRRSEIALLRRAEQGIGESMSMGVTLSGTSGETLDTGDRPVGSIDLQKPGQYHKDNFLRATF